MFGKPTIADELITAAGRDACGLAIRSLEFLPIGWDSRAWVYRAEATTGDSYFLKLRQWPVAEAGIAVPRYLEDHGIDQVVAAIPTVTGKLCHRLAEFVLVVYPYIDGASAMNRRLTDRQWVEYGAFLQALHETRLPADLERQLPRESYQPDATEVIRSLFEHDPDGQQASAARVELAAFWRARRSEIGQLLEHTEALGARLASRSREFVLCHADIHKANILIDEHERLRVVDWDSLALAPRERDLMFIVGGVVVPPRVEPDEEARFFEGYGQVEVDAPALAYYRHAWAVQDIGEFADQVFFRAGTDAATRAGSAGAFRRLFAPGGVVDSAHDSYVRLEDADLG